MLFAIVVFAAAAAAEIIDRVMAVVAGRVITLSDTQAAVRLGLVSAENVAGTTADALDRLVERALVLAEVARYAPSEPLPEAIAQRLAAVNRRFPSAAALTVVLAETGYSETRLREFVRDDVRIEIYLEQRFAGAQPADRRRALIAEWVDGLKRRTDISRLYLPAR